MKIILTIELIILGLCFIINYILLKQQFIFVGVFYSPITTLLSYYLLKGEKQNERHKE